MTELSSIYRDLVQTPTLLVKADTNTDALSPAWHFGHAHGLKDQLHLGYCAYYRTQAWLWDSISSPNCNYGAQEEEGIVR